MKLLTIAVLALLTGTASDDAPVVEGVRAHYVEGRTASVFAGACHYGSEYTTTGREAVLAWKLTAGTVDGASLAGIDVVAAVAGKSNLAIAKAERWSVVYLSRDLAEERAAAALAWLRAEHGATLGEIRNVKRTKVELRFAEESFAARAGDEVELVGNLLPNRECCAMPHKVWYQPFDSIEKPIAGEVDRFRCEDEDLGRSFTLKGVNCVFVGEVGAERPLLAAGTR